MSAYKPNIPQPNDNLDVSEVDLLNNFGQLDTSFAINHFAFSDNTANNGKHNYIQLTNRSIPPAPPLVGGDETLYSSVIAGNGELCFTRGNTGVQIQLTGPGDTKQATKGSTFLPGGIVLNWGFVNSTSFGSENFFQPFNTACVAIIANPNFVGPTAPSVSATVAIKNSPSTSAFIWVFVTSNTVNWNGFYYTAIGY